MIIVDGPDGSGKSTLIENLGYERRRLKSLRGGTGGVLPDGTGDGTAGWGGNDPALLCYARKVAEGGRVAFDRFHLSEIVYGPILRGCQELRDVDLGLLHKFLVERGVQVVMCLPPFDVTMRNVKQNGRERPHYQTDEFLQRAYAEFMRLTPWATVVYDFTRDPLPLV